MPRILTSDEIKDKSVEVNYDAGEWAFYFQLVGIGPNTMAEENFRPEKIPFRVPGYFISGNKEEAKAFMHSVIDAAFETLKEKK